MNAPIDVTNIRIETPRLILRPWRTSDLDDFFAYASVPGVGEMAGWMPHQSKEESAQILESFIERRMTLALQLRDSGKVIGSLGLHANDHDHVGPNYLGREIGYVLSKEYWGRGLMPEAVRAVIQYCFQTLSYDYLLCGHFSRNDQSRRVIEKCGFIYLKDILHETRMGTEELTKLYIIRNPDIADGCEHRSRA